MERLRRGWGYGRMADILGGDVAERMRLAGAYTIDMLDDPPPLPADDDRIRSRLRDSWTPHPTERLNADRRQRLR